MGIGQQSSHYWENNGLCFKALHYFLVVLQITNIFSRKLLFASSFLLLVTFVVLLKFHDFYWSLQRDILRPVVTSGVH